MRFISPQDNDQPPRRHPQQPGFSGEIVIENGRPVIKSASTLIGAAPPLMKQEEKYINALSKELRFSVTGNSLSIQVDGQDKPLRFTRMR